MVSVLQKPDMIPQRRQTTKEVKQWGSRLILKLGAIFGESTSHFRDTSRKTLLTTDIRVELFVSTLWQSRFANTCMIYWHIRFSNPETPNFYRPFTKLISLRLHFSN